MSNELARRAVAWKGWRWMPGWAFDGGGRMTEGMDVFGHILPDLSDDLTRLGLIVLVQEAHPECRIDLCDDMARVIRSDVDGVNVTDGWLPTAEALVKALEAAP